MVMFAIYCQQPTTQKLQIENFEKFFDESTKYLDVNNNREKFIENPDFAFEIGLAKFIDDFAFIKNRALTERIIKEGIWSFDAIRFFYIDILFSKLKNKKIDLAEKLNKAKEYQAGIEKISQ